MDLDQPRVLSLVRKFLIFQGFKTRSRSEEFQDKAFSSPFPPHSSSWKRESGSREVESLAFSHLTMLGRVVCVVHSSHAHTPCRAGVRQMLEFDRDTLLPRKSLQRCRKNGTFLALPLVLETLKPPAMNNAQTEFRADFCSRLGGADPLPKG